ncbi:LOW QUALITY PROTEIN: disks large-associated protein 1 [Aplochiton taeniatus]
MTMKGLSSSRSHHHAVTCDPSYDSMTLGHSERRPYFLNPGAPHPADHPYYAQRSSFQSECGPYSDLASSTFPRRHYSSHHELKEECGAVVPYTGGPTGAAKGGSNNRIPPNLLEQFERQAPVRHDGYHTLQYKRTAVEHQRSDSPGRIRHLVHSVQKLFTKSHSLEGPSGSGGGGRVNGSKASPDDPPSSSGTLKHSKRGKSKDRSRSEPKMRSAISGYWSSDDMLDREVCLYHHQQQQHSGGAAPSGVMTMGRHPEKSQSQYFVESYNTVSGHSLKTSRSNNDVKCSTCAGGGLPSAGALDGQLQLKKSSWSSTLTVSRAREVYQKASVNLDKALVKAEQQGRTCQFLQVPQDEWSGFSPLGKDDEIPCRRMRSGSYIKAMAEEDSGDSDCSPKPSPKVQARRASYLKATQPSLTEMTTLKISTEHSPKLQIRSHSYLRAVSEVSINRSLDSLDPAGLLGSPKFRSRNESYMRAMSTISQVSEVEVNGQIEAVCESVFSEMESQAVDALDLPMPGCFRMRSHSYVRAIEKGCSQDEEEGGCLGGARRALSPPRSATTVRTIQSSTVSSCITTYKKTPPPVPPRMTPSKPFISITAQSSTESAQDAYMDGGPGPRAHISSQPGLSNSTESIDSMKALTAAIEAANAQVHGPASQHVTNSTITITATATAAIARVAPDSRSQRDALRKCLSIGIQVDGPEEVEALEEHSKFQSVGIQVEDERCYRRMTRSNSVTTAVQADLDEPGDSPVPVPRHCATMPRQHSSRESASSTVSIQGSGNHYHACAADDYGEAGFDPSILPPPDPWMDSVAEPEDGPGGPGGMVCPQDGRWFLKLLQAETERMEGWCRQMERDEMENQLPDEVLGKIRSAVGSAQLLMCQKFQQFQELCEENLNPNAHPRPFSQDLAGFWDMLQLSIENISLKFDELHQLKANHWRPLDPPEERRMPPPVPKKPPKGPPPLARDRSLESSERQRLEARKRLLAAKRAASVRQSSATESADSIEIYIPEAQTRL